MIHLRLSDADRARLGCEEWLDVDAHSVTAREASILQRGFDLDGQKICFEHPGLWRRALAPEGASAPEFPALMVLVWLALRRAGITVALADLDFDLDQLAYKGDPVDEPEEVDPEASPGKGDEPPTSPDGTESSETSTL